MVPVCLVLQRVHVLVAVAGGALAYVLALAALGGFRHEDLRAIFRRVPARRSNSSRGRRFLGSLRTSGRVAETAHPAWNLPQVELAPARAEFGKAGQRVAVAPRRADVGGPRQGGRR